jgi:adenylate cyclase
MRDPVAQVNCCFRKAIEVARRQAANALELRAVMTLMRLTRSQNQRAVHRQILAEVWFHEGFDSADLKAARTLSDGSGARRLR